MNKLTLTQLISILQFESSVKVKYPDIIRRKVVATVILVITDLSVLLTTFIIAYLLGDILFSKSQIPLKDYLLLGSLYAAIFILIAGYEGLYPGFGIKSKIENRKVILIVLLLLVAFAIAIFIYPQKLTISAERLIISSIFQLFLLITCRRSIRKILSNFNWWGIPVVILMKDDDATPMIEYLNNNPALGLHPYVIVSTIDTKIREIRGIPVVEGIDVMSRLSGELHLDNAIIMYDNSPSEEHYYESLVYLQFFTKIYLYSTFIKKPFIEDIKHKTFRIVSSL